MVLTRNHAAEQAGSIYHVGWLKYLPASQPFNGKIIGYHGQPGTWSKYHLKFWLLAQKYIEWQPETQYGTFVEPPGIMHTLFHQTWPCTKEQWLNVQISKATATLKLAPRYGHCQGMCCFYC